MSTPSTNKTELPPRPSTELIAPVDATGLRRRQPRASEDFDEVDARIQIPIQRQPSLATQLKMKMNRKMNTAPDVSADGARVLQTGLSTYRSLPRSSGNGSNGTSISSAISPSSKGKGLGESPADHGLALVDKRQFAAAIPYFTEALQASSSGTSSCSSNSNSSSAPSVSSSSSSSSSSSMGMQSKVRLFYQRGNCYLAAQKYKLAIEDFSQVINMTPKNAQLFAKRGRAFAALGENHAALLDYNEAINQTASQGMLSDDYHGTSVMVVGSSSPSPSSSFSSSYTGSSDTVTQLRALYVARAKVYRAMNQLTNSLDDLGRAERYDGKRDADLYYLRAHVYLQCRQEQPALTDLDRFLELQEDHEMQMDSTNGSDDTSGSDTRRRIVDVLMERGKIVQRLAAEEEAQERKDAEVNEIEKGPTLQGQALPEKDLELATGNNKPGSPSKRRSTGGKHPLGPTPYKGIQAKRMVKQALRDYSRVLDMDPDHVEALRRRGEAFRHIEHYDEALEDFETALEKEPNAFEVHMARTKLFQQRGEIKRAIDELSTVLRVNGFFVDALFYRARLFEEIGELEKSKADYTSIIDAHYDCRGETPLSAGVETTVLATLSSMNASQRAGNITPRIANASKVGAARSSVPSSGSSAVITNATSSSGLGASGLKTSKMISEVAADALLCRARILEQCEEFDAAMADYQQILDSPSKNSKRLDAQLELQSAIEKKELFQKRREREAVAWLVQNAKELDSREDLGKLGSAPPGGNGTNASGSSSGKSKKKKKKNKKKKKSAGYTLMTDEEDVEIVVKPASEDVKQDSTDEREDSAEKASVSGEASTTIEPASASDEVGKLEMAASVGENSEELKEDTAIIPEVSISQSFTVKTSNDGTKSPAMKAVAMTRDEAFDSMWEEGDEEADTPDTSLNDGGRGLVDDNKSSSMGTTDVGRNEEEEEGDDTAESTTDSTSNEKTTVREVLMDDKYLKKRQRQLEKLRASLLEFTQSRDKSAIREVLERVERKKMSDALVEEIEKANNVLNTTDEQSEEERVSCAEATEDAKAWPASSFSDRSSEKSETGEKRSSDPDGDISVPTVTGSGTDRPTGKASSTSSAFKLHVVSPTHQVRGNESQTNNASSSGLRTSGISTTLSTSAPSSTSATAATTTTTTVSGKPPALVIRPIAYNHALQVAEQNQHDLLQHQRLVQEKDAEIVFLKQLLAQSRQADTFAHLDRLDERDSTFQSRLVQLRTRFPHQRVETLKRSLEELVDWMGPTGDADYVRQKVLTFVQRVLEAQFPPGTPIMFYPTGSFPMKTYLPTSDVDICLLVPKELEPTWYFPVMHALCLAGNTDVGASVAGTPTAVNAGVGVMNGSPTTSKLVNGGATATAAAVAAVMSGGSTATGGVPTPAGLLTNTVRNVSFINADVRVIKCTIDNVAVDLTANRVAALGAVMLLDEMDVRVGKNHLLKKSLIAIKAWCVHESATYASSPSASGGGGGGNPAHQSVMGASHGAFSTYAINTIVMALFNQYGDAIKHPLQALFLFLDRMAEFPWHELAMTLYGPVPLSVLATTPLGPVNGTGTSTVAQLKKARAKSYTFGEAVAGAAKAGNKQYGEVMESEDIAGIRVSLLEQFAPFDSTLAASDGDGYKGMFPVRVCNIVDPLDEKNNLARSVSVDWFPMMKRAFRLGRNRLATMLFPGPPSGDKSTSGSDRVVDFYAQSWKLYGRGDGWRPDLLVHPRQTWHGKASLNGVDPRSAKTLDEMRWESLLPAPPLVAGPFPAMYPLHYQQQLHHQQQIHQQQAMHHGHHHSAQPFYSPHPHQRIATSPITIGASTSSNGTAASGHGVGGANTFFSQHQQSQQRRQYAGGNGSNGGSKSSPQRSGLSAGDAKSSRRYDSPPPYAVHYSSK